MKSNNDVSASHDSQEGSLPFFARFLEGQYNTELGAVTLKYPSDRDEMDHTMKYPSDSDEGDVE